MNSVKLRQRTAERPLLWPIDFHVASAWPRSFLLFRPPCEAPSRAKYTPLWRQSDEGHESTRALERLQVGAQVSALGRRAAS